MCIIFGCILPISEVVFLLRYILALEFGLLFYQMRYNIRKIRVRVVNHMKL